METALLGILIPIIVAVVAAIPGTLLFIAQRRKNNNDLATSVNAAALALVNPLRSELEKATGKIIELSSWAEERNKQIAALEVRILAQSAEITDLKAIILQKITRITELQLLLDDRDHRIVELKTDIKAVSVRLDALEESKKPG